MIVYDVLEIESVDDFDKLMAYKAENEAAKEEHPLLPLRPQYIDDNAIQMIKNLVGDKCSKIVLEYPYYDKDYLSTYYIFYSKKFKPYEKKSIRLNLFNKVDGKENLMGYITLRPTMEGTKIGRTYINPRYVIKQEADTATFVILSKQKLHTADEKEYVECFPWMCQQKDITVCAHIALWALIRSLSAKSSLYAETPLGKIAEQVEHYSEKIHSHGLTPQQIATILMENNLSTVIQRKRDYLVHIDEMISYVDSGFAFIGGLSNYTHAVAVIGYNINKKKFGEKASDKAWFNGFLELSSIKILEGANNDGKIIYETPQGKRVKMRIVSHSRIVESLIVNDDQRIPYLNVDVHDPGIFKKQDMDKETQDNNVSDYYMATDIDYIVVPFYNRIQLSYRDAWNKFVSLVSSMNFKWTTDECDTIFVRGFLAHANEYKRYALMKWNSEEVALVCQSLETPKYLWCFEVSSLENYVQNKVDSVVMLDSTASANDRDSSLFIKTADTYYYYDVSGTYVDDHNDYDIFASPLREIKLKEELVFDSFNGGASNIWEERDGDNE